MAEAIPGLEGLFGIDILLTAEGPVVVEVNPRLTTAYAGLRRALGIQSGATGAGASCRRSTARPVEVALA